MGREFSINQSLQWPLHSRRAIKPLSAGHFLMAFPNSYQKVEHSKKCGRIFKDGAKTSVLIKNESICSVLMHSKKLKDYPFQFLKKKNLLLISLQRAEALKEIRWFIPYIGLLFPFFNRARPWLSQER